MWLRGRKLRVLLARGQRQVAQQVLAVEEDVTVAEHHALGPAGGAGGVDEREQVVGLHGGFEGFQRGHVGGGAQGQQVGEGAVARAWRSKVKMCSGPWVRPGHGLLHPGQQLLAFHQHHPHAGILENVAVVLHRDGGVHGHAHGPQLGNAHIGHHPLGAVGANDGHFIGGPTPRARRPRLAWLLISCTLAALSGCQRSSFFSTRQSASGVVWAR